MRKLLIGLAVLLLAGCDISPPCEMFELEIEYDYYYDVDEFRFYLNLEEKRAVFVKIHPARKFKRCEYKESILFRETKR